MEYLNGETIRRLREARGLTQASLAAEIGVSDKAVSRWETGRGYPDITLIPPLAAALSVSVTELFSGDPAINRNRHGNMKQARFYVCPVCGNLLIAAGEASVSCHGITLYPETAQEPDEAHTVTVEPVEDEYYLSSSHPMSKEHYLSFFAAVTDAGVSLIKLYPESDAAARFSRRRVHALYAFCNRHGLFRVY